MTDVSPEAVPAGAQGGGAKRHLIIFTTDAGFMMPTMSVIDQLLAQPRVMALADIIVYLVDIDADRRRALEDAFGHLPVRFVEIPPELLKLSGDVSFNPTHVPHSTLARLSLGELLPEQYDHVLYLDGDIQLLGDIAPLVEHQVAPGKIEREVVAMRPDDRRAVPDLLLGRIGEPPRQCVAWRLAGERRSVTDVAQREAARAQRGEIKLLYVAPERFDAGSTAERLRAMGVALLAVVPLPSAPRPLSPQQYASPADPSAHVCRSPAAIETNLASVSTGAAQPRADVVPSPS